LYSQLFIEKKDKHIKNNQVLFCIYQLNRMSWIFILSVLLCFLKRETNSRRSQCFKNIIQKQKLKRTRAYETYLYVPQPRDRERVKSLQ
jgi:hypothetical protein